MKRIIFTRENETLEKYAEIKGVSVTDMSDFGVICLELDRYTILPDEFANHFLMFIEQYQSSCAMLSVLHVDEVDRGKGIGRNLVKSFNQVTKDIDFKFVVARKHIKQREGFNLKDFYKRQGFESIFETEDEWVMVNKEKAPEVNEFFS